VHDDPPFVGNLAQRRDGHAVYHNDPSMKFRMSFSQSSLALHPAR
jgi:hypothetical protein